ncbi:Vomp family autotransporter [Bartonella machadoae]|uniref:Vomp family autotransporter n=1 Tax=Bartonella machadoae TaxID=2893471 RepID=UPI001F4C7248|nr:Vomp family autotransporter [Bartonella machadoae]UNE54513.1 Vomp family autotransporter [Bartonella machadoae]
MKKYSTPNLVKAISLGTAIAALLSSVSPVFAANLAITGGTSLSTPGGGVSYSHGSHGSIVFAGDDDYCGADSVVGRGGKQQQTIKDTQRITAEQQYERFIGEKVFNGRSPYGTTTEQVTWMSEGILTNDGTYMGRNTFGVINAMPEAYGVYSFATGCGSAATGNYSTVFGAGATAKAGGAQAFGVSALAGGIASIATGVDSEASGKSAVAIGGLSTALGENSVALGTRVRAEENYAIAIGSEAEAQASGSIAIGSRRSDRTEEANPNRKVIAEAENAIAIGTFAYAKTADSVAIGVNAQVFSKDGVAIGGGSISYKEKGIAGYDPHSNGASTDNGIAWKSTTGAFSVGEVGVAANGTKGTLTRQITGVAAGSDDTDAVNVAQLKAMRDVIAGGGEGWKVSVNGEDSTAVNGGNIVDFSVNSKEKDNLKIEKDSANNKHEIKFALSDTLKLTSVTTGQSSMSDDGFIIENGPRITVDGIDAGNQKITGVVEGDEDNDAVNFKQLKEVKGLISQAGGWKLAVDSGDATDVNPGSIVDFVPAKKNDSSGANTENIKIKKDGNTVTFELNDYLQVKSITAGKSFFDDGEFGFTGGGPVINLNGISAGSKPIRNVEDGVDGQDAVNVSQLNKVKDLISTAGGWKLSVNDDEATDINSGSTVNFVAVKQKDDDDNETENTNIKITKGDNNEVKFDLSEYIKVGRVETGNTSLSHAGLQIKGGPRVFKGGIVAGNTTISEVKDGVLEQDAVNVKQLNEVKGLISKAGGWKLSVDGADATDVNSGDTVSLEAVEKEDASGEKTKNIKIVKDDQNKVQFDLADNLKVTSVTAGRSVLSDDGFIIDGGPRITFDGIEAGNKKITGVAAGEGDTDAVNYKQLKDFTTNIKTGWKLAVENEEATDIGAESTVKFVAAVDKDSHKNINIVRGDNNEIKFDLNEVIKVNKKIEVGDEVTITDNGLKIKRGPSITYGGIDASDKEIRNVAEGILGTDAVNLNQLNDVEKKIQEVAENNLVKWDEEQKLITIGKEKEGAKIDITNKSGDARTISGVKDGGLYEDSTEAVNGSQINEISGDIAEFFGGDAAFEDGKFVGPKYNLSTVSADGTVKQKTFENVGEALTGLDANVKNVNSRLTHVTNDFTKKIDALSQDALLWSDNEQAFVALHGANGEKTNSKITFLKDGEIDVNSTDAINGSQLFKVAQNTSKYFGGSTDVLEGIEPTFLIQGNKHNNVTDAFTDVNVSITNLDNKIIEMKENNLVQQEGISGVITIGAKTAGTEINIAGTAGVRRKISGVQAAEKGDEAVNKDQLDKSIEKVSKDALLWSEDEQAFVALHEKDGEKTKSKLKFLLDGDIAANSTDAITGNQLYLMSNQLAAYFGGGAKYENGEWTEPSFKISKIDADGTVKEQTHHNVADALGDLNGGMVNINNRIDEIKDKVTSDVIHWNKDEKAYDASHDGKPGKIINVADGKIAQGSKDAVNGGQLWETNERIDGVEKHMNHIENRVDNISTTVTNIGETVNNIGNKVDHIDDKVNDLVDGVVLYDRDENGKKTNKVTLIGGNESEPVTIDNVADGRIEKGSKEAINGGQLHDYTQEQMKIILDQSKNYTDQRVNNIVIDAIDDAVERANNYTNMKFEALNYSIENVRKEAKQAAAIGLAVSNLRYNDTPGKLSVAFGSGLWRSQSAFAFGAGYTSEKGNIRSNLSVTSSGGHWGVGAGFNMTLN